MDLQYTPQYRQVSIWLKCSASHSGPPSCSIDAFQVIRREFAQVIKSDLDRMKNRFIEDLEYLALSSSRKLSPRRACLNEFICKRTLCSLLGCWKSRTWSKRITRVGSWKRTRWLRIVFRDLYQARLLRMERCGCLRKSRQELSRTLLISCCLSRHFDCWRAWQSDHEFFL